MSGALPDRRARRDRLAHALRDLPRLGERVAHLQRELRLLGEIRDGDAVLHDPWIDLHGEDSVFVTPPREARLEAAGRDERSRAEAAAFHVAAGARRPAG